MKCWVAHHPYQFLPMAPFPAAMSLSEPESLASYLEKTGCVCCKSCLYHYSCGCIVVVRVVVLLLLCIVVLLLLWRVCCVVLSRLCSSLAW